MSECAFEWRVSPVDGPVGGSRRQAKRAGEASQTSGWPTRMETTADRQQTDRATAHRSEGTAVRLHICACSTLNRRLAALDAQTLRQPSRQPPPPCDRPLASPIVRVSAAAVCGLTSWNEKPDGMTASSHSSLYLCVCLLVVAAVSLLLRALPQTPDQVRAQAQSRRHSRRPCRCTPTVRWNTQRTKTPLTNGAVRPPRGARRPGENPAQSMQPMASRPSHAHDPAHSRLSCLCD